MATNTTATSQTHNANGSTASFAISFSFLDNTEVDVRVGGVLKTITTHYTISSSTVTFTSGNIPPSGTANISFTRDTNISTKKVDFADGSVLTETDLDNNTDQLLLAQQEIINDYVKRDGSQTITGNFVFEGATDDGNETTLAITDPTADRTITVPDITGTLVTTGDTGTVSNNMLADAELKELATMPSDTASSLADLTAAEVQTIDGITASTSELNKLDGVTASTDEINKLDGVTATTTEINYVDGVTSNIQTQLNNKQPLDNELTTLAGMQAATASKLADSTALTSDIADLNQIDGLTKQTTISDSDASFPTSGAVVDFVAAQIAPIGGLEVIANEDSFPTSQPASGVVISISDIEGLITNGSGVATNARTTGNGSDNVTINGFPSSLYSKTMAAGLGLMVSSTGSSQTYTYHKLLAKEADVEQLSNDINDFAARYRVTNGEPNSDNDEGDLIYDKDADKMKVFDSTTNAFKEVTSVGDYKFLFLCPAGGTGSPTINGNIATYDLREGSTSGSAATVTNAAQLLVSINGVLQKPNTGTSAPSEGFAMVDSNTIIFGSNLPTGASIFIVQIGSATTLNVPADNSVSTAKLQSNSVTPAKLSIMTSSNNAGTTGKLRLNPEDNTTTWQRENKHLHQIRDDVYVESTVNVGDKAGFDFTPLAISAFSYSGTTLTLTTATHAIAVGDNILIKDSASGFQEAFNTISGTTGTAVKVTRGSDPSSSLSTANTKVIVYTPADPRGCINVAKDHDKFDQNTFNPILRGYVGKDLDTPAGVNTEFFKLEVKKDSSAADHVATLLHSTRDFGSGQRLALTIDDGNSYPDGKNLVLTQNGVKITADDSAFTDSDELLEVEGNAKIDGNLEVTGTLSAGGDGTISGDELFLTDSIKHVGDTDTSISFPSNDLIRLRTNGSQRIDVDSAGNVLIGTQSGISVGTVNLLFDNNSKFGISTKGSAGGSATHLSFFDSSNNNTGSIVTSSGGSTSYNTSSDYRLKENKAEISDGITRVKALKPYKFNFKADPNTTVDGFFAHEVSPVVPEAIIGTKDEVDSDNKPVYQVIDQSKLVPLLTAALQEAIAKIETLETKVAALEAN